MIQRLTEEFLPAVIDLDRTCLGGLWSLDGYRREIASPNSDLIILLTNHEATPHVLGLGCLWAIVEEAHITLLAVHPDYHRQGLGQALLWKLLHSAQCRGLERATLEVKTSNLPAISLYKKFGFQAVGVRKGYYPDTGEDALILWRGGLHHSDFTLTLAHWHQQVCDRLKQSHWRFLQATDSW